MSSDSDETSPKPKRKRKLQICHECEARSKRKRTVHLGDCPICLEELGKRAMVSTQCGHVFCRKCLKRSLKMERKCPACRHSLEERSSYHRLYLGVEVASDSGGSKKV